MPNQSIEIWRPNRSRAPVARPGIGLFQLEPLERRYHLSAQVDPTFGVGGHAYISGPPGTVQWGTSMAVQRDGSILLMGIASPAKGDVSRAVVLRRLLPDGALDPTFHPAAMPDTWWGKMLLQDDGKIVVMSDDGLLRLTADGQVDPTFHYRPLVPPSERISGIEFDDAKLLPDGRILANVSFVRDQEAVESLQRFNVDGSPDESFGQGGVATPVPDNTYLASASPTADGHVMLITDDHGDDRYGLWRLNEDGSVDPTFGVGGRATIPLLPWATDPNLIPQNPLVVRSDGTIIVGVSEVYPFEDYEIVLDDLARFTPDGKIDPTFGNGGILALPYEPQSIDLSLRDDDEIDVVLKYYDEPGTPGANRAIGVFRLGADDTPDTGFAPDGIVRIDGATIGDAIIARQGDRLIVLANGTDIDRDHVDPARFFHLVRVGDAPARSVDDQADFATPQSAGDARPAWSQTPIFDDGQDELDWDSIHQVWS